ncbi:hypothetical protein B1748_30880 [Paenibacillus sp. MY03]|jgi:hypothetical protein|uniref:hypothetical protein n=1 Tax=Paenibacillus sp. MY03 TaxID=302980 RepID=UPI000B3C136B|nr:hypothetical protein [Paenibacillus sp. MY03]OUS69573.1 hypothetical protein B1748_30880 [Paenibacillus sp. MY03]
MHKAHLKKNITRFFVLFIGVFIIYSIYIHLEYRQNLNQIQDRNDQIFSFISVAGNNLANRLTEFVQLPIEQENSSEVKKELYNNWRIVRGESKSIHSELQAISTVHMRKEASDWSLLQYSLFRVDGFIDGMTNKFLEQHSYAISSEEKKKMEAVITIYKTIHAESEDELVDLENILLSIKEPMLVIDDYYQITLERVGRSTQ